MNKQLYDRQTRVYGIESTNMLNNANVYIYGQKSELLFELCKNLILSGVININIINDNDICKGDKNFFGNIQKQKWNKIITELNNLNSLANIKLLNPSTFSNTDIKNGIFVFINNVFDLVKINDKLHGENKFVSILTLQNKFKFINDFGKHTITDIDGENYDLLTITQYLLNDDDSITIKTNGNHNLSNKNKILLSMKDIYIETSVLKVIDSMTFVINKPTIDFTFTNGYVKRIKEPLIVEHKKLINFINVEEYNDISIFHNPVYQCIYGALLASECIKAITCKYIPFNQSHEFDIKPINIPKHIEDLKFFIVGSGAIGCELLKYLAMCNVKNISITDPDHIEVSNLSRQFLFRNNDVHKSKSLIASEKIKEFNPNINITPFEHKLSNENQSFVDQQFPNHDIIFNALDNLSARLYVDSQCLKYCKPLFESGTLGTKGNTQPIIPHITESYGASQDIPTENNFAVCTIKHFPTQIQHTIHYAMDDFNGLFNKQPQILKKFFENSKSFNVLNENENEIEYNYSKIFLHNVLNVIKHLDSIEDYVNWAYCLWYDRFVRRVNRLLKIHPENKVLEDGTLFWSNGKKCPKVNEIDKEYINITTRLLINTYKKLSLNYDIDIDELIENYDFTNICNTIYIDDPDYEHETYPTMPIITIDKDDFIITVQDFEKDNDENYHVGYITATSNNRAKNYDIPIATFYETKGIAGKIIPALATTTSIVAGLIIIEMLKYVRNKNTKIEEYSSYFINLADNTFIFGDPFKPKINKVNGKEFTEWDKFEFNGNDSLYNFKKYILEKFNVEISLITVDTSIIYADFKETDQSLSLNNLLIQNNINESNIELFIACDDDTIELPMIKLI